ncbi:Uma2 family endonuclease [Xylophilus sp.]|uniref:Uma2 family endonuclease n=1 Tax=Xylophilus sp. TaxID=2653893 RepID=UPI002D80D67C|nr:Uma2 family endonuclease [Xylophilus sp.]
MARVLQQPYLTAADHLAWEETQTERHEYIDGEIVHAMAGGEGRHATAALNFAVVLREHLCGSPCRTYLSGVRLHLAASSAYFSPDLMVTPAMQPTMPIGWQNPSPRSSPGSFRPARPTTTPGPGSRTTAASAACASRCWSTRPPRGRRLPQGRRRPVGAASLRPRRRGDAAVLTSVDLTLPLASLFADLEAEAPAL